MGGAENDWSNHMRTFVCQRPKIVPDNQQSWFLRFETSFCVVKMTLIFFHEMIFSRKKIRFEHVDKISDKLFNNFTSNAIFWVWNKWTMMLSYLINSYRGRSLALLLFIESWSLTTWRKSQQFQHWWCLVWYGKGWVSFSVSLHVSILVGLLHTPIKLQHGSNRVEEKESGSGWMLVQTGVKLFD